MIATGMTIKSWLRRAAVALREHGCTHPMQEGLSLLAHLLGRSKEEILREAQDRIAPEEVKRLEALLEKRLHGCPLAYLKGSVEFYSLPILVSPATLIPRSDTELLVQCALEQGSVNHTFLELGTGSGAVICSLAKQHPEGRFIGTDISEQALAVAQQNLEALGLLNVTLYRGDWWFAVPDQRFGLICSNPPYLSKRELDMLSESLRFEPQIALLAGVHGTEMLHQVIAGAPHYLIAGGSLLLEHGAEQGETVRKLLKVYGYTEISTCQDLAGRDRVTMARCRFPL